MGSLMEALISTPCITATISNIIIVKYCLECAYVYILLALHIVVGDFDL